MIYILEDDDNIRKLINYSLKNQGFEVQNFALPSAFWKALENHKSDLLLLDIMLPVVPSENITTHIAMLHTIFNICATALFVPFVNQIASISRKVIPETKAEKDEHYHLPAILPHSRISADLYSYQIQAEISKMSAKVMEMFDSVCNSFMNPKNAAAENDHVKFLENLSDETCSLMHTVNKYVSNESFDSSFIRAKEIEDYIERVRIFYEQVCVYFTVGFTEGEKLAGEAGDAIEQKIDETKKELKKASRKRLESGADVKEELQYIDIVRKVERAGDCVYAMLQSV